MSKNYALRALWLVSAALLLVGSAALASASGKANVCHKGKSIVIGVDAVAAHVKHGDAKGKCAAECLEECGEYADAEVICSDGNYYNSPCAAECQGAIGCVGFVSCSSIYDPVICESGSAYINACQAMMFGEGSCREISELDCAACPTNYYPLICSDGNAYDNSCESYCAGAAGCVWDDRAACAAACPSEVAPVVCPDGATYGNFCLAACARADAQTCALVSR